jgi:predicted aspartyl protease
MSQGHGAALTIPVSIEGMPTMMAIDTGSVLTGVDPQSADTFHLIRKRIIQGAMFTSAGQSFTEMATMHSFDIGQMHAEGVKILVWPTRMWGGDSNISGTVGADLLRNYDVDIDTDTNKFKLFSQDHCPGKVVYWHPAAVSVVPIHVVNSGHIIVPVVLDGQNMDALLDTGAFGTILALETAEGTFGLHPGTPEMTPAGDFHGAAAYHHTFKSLELEGISIANPTVFIWDDQMKYGMQQTPELGSRLSAVSEENGKTDLTLGMRELRHLHIYIAYKEQKMYVSAIAPSASTAPPAAPPAAPTPPK